MLLVKNGLHFTMSHKRSRIYMTIDERLKELDIVLPNPPSPAANYVTIKRVGNLMYTSGQDARQNGELLYKGKLGQNISTEEGYQSRSEEHTSELQSRGHLVCRLLLEKKK